MSKSLDSRSRPTKPRQRMSSSGIAPDLKAIIAAFVIVRVTITTSSGSADRRGP